MAHGHHRKALVTRDLQTSISTYSVVAKYVRTQIMAAYAHYGRIGRIMEYKNKVLSRR